MNQIKSNELIRLIINFSIHTIDTTFVERIPASTVIILYNIYTV